MNDKEKLIERLIQEKGGTKQQYLSLLDAIAYHESAHTLDPKVKQHGGGPGRGKYQFEEGKNQGGITAARRTKRYLESIGEEVPEWLQNATSGDSLDATKLTSEQQDVLFLGNMRMHPKADFAKVIQGEETVTDFWANYHWAGDDKDRDERVASFNDSLKSYKKADPDQIQQNRIKKQIAEYTNEAVASAKVRDRIPQQPQQVVQPKIRQPHQWEMLGDARGELAQEALKEIAPTAQFNTDYYGDLMGYVKSNSNKLTQYNEGGRHEQNPLGGIPIGMGANGKPNTVEEGETSYNFGKDKFVFSDRISINDARNNTVKLINTPINNTFAYGGPTDPTDPRSQTVKAKDNTATVQTSGQMKSQANNFYKEFIAEQSDKQELKTTGTIAKPRSLAYTTPVKEQPMLKQDTMSSQARRENVKAANEIANTKSVSALEAPLVYLANPFKAAGDLSEAIGYKNHPFPTSKEDAQEIKRQHYFGNRSALEQGMDYVPEAALNIATGDIAIPKNGIAKKAIDKLTKTITRKYEVPVHNINFGIDNADQVATAGLSPKKMYDNWIEKKAVESISRGGGKLEGKATRAAALPGFKQAKQKAIDDQVNYALKLHEDIVGDPSILDNYFTKKSNVATAATRYVKKRAEASSKYAARLRNEKGDALPLAQEFSDYFSYLEKQEGVKLFKNSKKGRKQLESLLDNKDFVDRFVEAQSHGQRAISKVDKSLSADQKREILDHYFTNAGTGWLPNSLYTSNSEFISNRFSSVDNANIEEGYVADLRFNFPGLDDKAGKEELQAYRNLVRLDTQPDFKNLAYDRKFPIYQARYGDNSSAERIITDEFLKENPNFVTVKSIKKNIIEDPDAHLKMGKMGTRHAQGSPEMFHHDSSIPDRYSKGIVSEEDIIEQSVMPDIYPKAIKKMDEKGKALENEYKRVQEAKTTFDKRLKEEGYPYNFLDRDGKTITDSYIFERLKQFDNIGKARFKDDVKGIGVLGAGTATVGVGGTYMYNSFKESAERRKQRNQELLAQNQPKVDSLLSTQYKYNQELMEIAGTTDLREISKKTRKFPEYKEVLEQYRDTEDPVKKLELNVKLDQIRLKIAKKLKNKS